jgi:hypothetical protein
LDGKSDLAALVTGDSLNCASDRDSLRPPIADDLDDRVRVEVLLERSSADALLALADVALEDLEQLEQGFAAARGRAARA